MKIVRVISGGQTGIDTAGLLAAEKCGLPTGGYAPLGYLTEKGPRPKFLGKRMGLQEHSSEKYAPRTRENISRADFTLLIAQHFDKGSRLTATLAYKMKKPIYQITRKACEDPTSTPILQTMAWISTLKMNKVVINIAGNRESRSPGIELIAYRFLLRLFNALKKGFTEEDFAPVSLARAAYHYTPDPSRTSHRNKHEPERATASPTPPKRIWREKRKIRRKER